MATTPAFSTSKIPQFKIVLCGDGGVGKTSLVRRLQGCEFDRRYYPTIGVEVHPMTWYTTRGLVVLNVWDAAGQYRLRDSYFFDAAAGIVMFDVTSRMTYKHVHMWYKDIIRVCGKIPIVMIGNKVDIKERKVKPRYITFHRKKDIPYYETSVKANYNIEKPFISILQILSGDHKLELVTGMALGPPAIILTEEQRNQLEIDRENTYKVPLLPEDDDI